MAAMFASMTAYKEQNPDPPNETETKKEPRKHRAIDESALEYYRNQGAKVIENPEGRTAIWTPYIERSKVTYRIRNDVNALHPDGLGIQHGEKIEAHFQVRGKEPVPPVPDSAQK